MSAGREMSAARCWRSSGEYHHPVMAEINNKSAAMMTNEFKRRLENWR